MTQLMPLPLTVSCFNKSRLVLPFWYWLTWVVPDKGPLNNQSIKVICNARSVVHKFESEARAVASGRVLLNRCMSACMLEYSLCILMAELMHVAAYNVILLLILVDISFSDHMHKMHDVMFADLWLVEPAG